MECESERQVRVFLDLMVMVDLLRLQAELFFLLVNLEQQLRALSQLNMLASSPLTRYHYGISNHTITKYNLVLMQTLDVSQWDYLNEGVLHLVLEYRGSQTHFQNKVLILQKEDHLIQSAYHDTKDLNKRLSDLHHEILMEFWDINKFLLRVQRISITCSQKYKFIVDVLKRLGQIQRKGKTNATIDRDSDILLADNLFKPRMANISVETVAFEIKPKTTMFSRYLPQTIETLASKLKVDYNSIDKILRECPLQEKTRWFKKMYQLKEENKNKISPFDIFGYTGKGYLDQSLKASCFKKGKEVPLQEIRDPNFYDEVVNTALKRSGVLEHIKTLQMLYDKSYYHFQSYTAEEIEQSLRMAKLQEIRQMIANAIKNSPRSKMSESQINQEQLDETVGIDILKMLISATWRDISLIIEVSMMPSGSEIEDVPEGYDVWRADGALVCCRVTVIDYSLKPISRTCSYWQKDSQVLEYYVRSHLCI